MEINKYLPHIHRWFWLVLASLPKLHASISPLRSSSSNSIKVTMGGSMWYVHKNNCFKVSIICFYLTSLSFSAANDRLMYVCQESPFFNETSLGWRRELSYHLMMKRTNGLKTFFLSCFFLRTYGLTFCPWLKSKPHDRRWDTELLDIFEFHILARYPA